MNKCLFPKFNFSKKVDSLHFRSSRAFHPPRRSAPSSFIYRAKEAPPIQDAHEQLTRKIRCWEPIEEDIAGNHFSGEHRLSEPIYELCTYMPDPKDFNKGYDNGVDMDSDDYTNVFSFFHLTHHRLVMLNVCLQEAFQFHSAGRPSQTSIRCLCKRDGCNLPKEFTSISTSSRFQRRLSK
ncbi:hypothetical protein B9Z55_023659 [Caenorhabditis nigoni]|uniref:Uncharacterized protein n=1 Tax=Caenorhabditis nigoni TaxID=1611254 RepID=A0A2G5SQQ3_9PELO|nr:hypothetical protein B9Z55_023659 [Caenorhabditis nigoni]